MNIYKVHVRDARLGYYDDNYDVANISWGKIYLKKYSIDTLEFYFKGKVPILIAGLQNFESDTIIIESIPKTHYIPIDSSSFYSIKYLSKDSLDYSSEKVKSKTPYNSLRFVKKKKSIVINGAVFDSSIIADDYETDQWYCTKNEVSIHYLVKGIKYSYMFILKN